MIILQEIDTKGTRPEKLKECINPHLDKWLFRYNLQQEDKSIEDLCLWQEVWTQGEPTIEEIHTFLIQKSKEEEQAVMNAGFVWEGMRIRLDDENQTNFKQQFDLQLAGIYPLDAKYFFGEHSEIVYSFTSVDKLKEWIVAMGMFKSQTKDTFVRKRQSINLEDYRL